jgi:hypothetical protein
VDAQRSDVRSIVWLDGWGGFKLSVEQKELSDGLLCLASVPGQTHLLSLDLPKMIEQLLLWDAMNETAINARDVCIILVLSLGNISDPNGIPSAKQNLADRVMIPARSLFVVAHAGGYHLTSQSSAAATGSEAENLWNCFSHKNCERAAGSRRLQRFVRSHFFFALSIAA